MYTQNHVVCSVQQCLFEGQRYVDDVEWLGSGNSIPATAPAAKDRATAAAEHAGGGAPTAGSKL